MKDDKPHKPALNNNPEIKSILESLLSKTIESFNHQQYISEIIKHTFEYRQEKGLIFSTTEDPKMYITQLWNHFFADITQEKSLNQSANQSQVSDQKPQQNEMYQKKSTNQILLQAAISRQNNVWDELKDNRLKIQIKPKYKELQKPPEQPNKNKQNKKLNESKASANSEKDFLEFVKNQKLQKEKRKKLFEIQHLKQLQKQKKLQEEQQKLKEIEQAKLRQQKRRKQQQLIKKRSNQKQIIKRHQFAYSEFQNKIFHSTQKQQPFNLLQRFQSEQLKKIKEEKQQLYKSFDKSQLDQHQKCYLDTVQKRNQQRYKRMQEINQIQEMQNEKSRVKFRSSFKFQKPQQEYEKRKKEQYLQAKEKRDRILSYKEKVKSDFVPEVDQNKKNQLLKLMEDLEMSRKGQYRKKVMKDGEVVLQKIDLKDAREVGLNYLEDIKKQVAKMRAMKRQSGDSFMDSSPQQDPKCKKPIDYLKQMRESKSKSTSGFTSPRKTAFTNTKSSEISFEQKMRKIQDMTTKLMEKTKQQQMLLKYGKFKTSEEILTKKEIIDRNYIDLLNMKLEMIERQERRLGS